MIDNGFITGMICGDQGRINIYHYRRAFDCRGGAAIGVATAICADKMADGSIVCLHNDPMSAVCHVIPIRMTFKHCNINNGYDVTLAMVVLLFRVRCNAVRTGCWCLDSVSLREVIWPQTAAEYYHLILAGYHIICAQSLCRSTYRG